MTLRVPGRRLAGILPARPARVWQRSRESAVRIDPDDWVCLAYRYLTAVDIAGFSCLNALDQVNMQNDLGHVLDLAASGTGLDRTLWQVQECGDGELAVLPSDTDGPKLIAEYPRELTRALSDVNKTRHIRLRIRAAIHYGPFVQGRFGPAGQGPIVVSRLLDSDRLRKYLAQRTELDLVLIVSASLYQDVIETCFCRLDAAQFARADVRAKGRCYPAYILNPNHFRPVDLRRISGHRANLITARGREGNGAPGYVRVTWAVVGRCWWNRLCSSGVHRRLSE